MNRDDGAVAEGRPGREPAADAMVDASGLRCPLPVIRLAAAARGAAPGTVLELLATDPAARHDVPAWARMRGHEVLDIREESGTWRLVVRLGDGAAPAG